MRLFGERGTESRKSVSSVLGAIYVGLQWQDGGSGSFFTILFIPPTPFFFPCMSVENAVNNRTEQQHNFPVLFYRFDMLLIVVVVACHLVRLATKKKIQNKLLLHLTHADNFSTLQHS